MTSNIWVASQFEGVLSQVFKKRKLDLIPAICNGIEGVCMVSMTPEEIGKVCGSLSRGVEINCTGNMVAKIIGKDIFLEVCSIHPLKENQT